MIQTFPTANYPTYMQAQGYYHSVPQYTQRLQQQQPTSLPDIHKPIQPTSNDVLMGRGGNNNKWHGNQRLRDMANAQVEQYKKADKKEKNKTSILLVAQVKALSPPGRFLKRDPNTLSWHVVPDELAREKASQCLRDAVSGAKKQYRNSPDTTSTTNKDNITPISLSAAAVSSVTGKRRAITCNTDSNMINHSDSPSRKRQRVQAPFKNQNDANIPSPDQTIISNLLENAPPANSFFNGDFTNLFSVLEAHLDLNDLSDESNNSLDDNLSWEPIPLSQIL